MSCTDEKNKKFPSFVRERSGCKAELQALETAAQFFGAKKPPSHRTQVTLAFPKDSKNKFLKVFRTQVAGTSRVAICCLKA